MEKQPSQQTSDQWRRDPDNWVWGLFYYNKEDGRIFPPKRIPEMGFTLNFANPKSVLACVAFFAFFIFVVVLIASGR